MAVNTNTATSTAPMIAPGFLTSRYHASPQRPLGPFEDDLGRLELGDAHEYRMRGLMIAYEMSTIRFTRTNTSATKRIPPWITG